MEVNAPRLDAKFDETMTDVRIVSFLPAATEMVCGLGLADWLVGVSHECDYPPVVRAKPVVVHPALPMEQMSLREIDRAVSERLRTGASLYEIDERRLRDLAPTLIFTQNLCQVCAPSGNEIAQVLKSLRPPPEILWLTPKIARRRERQPARPRPSHRPSGGGGSVDRRRPRAPGENLRADPVHRRATAGVLPRLG